MNNIYNVAGYHFMVSGERLCKAVKEIAGFIGKSASAVKMRLQKGRRMLNETYRKEYM